jgi:hypothetical protein
MNNGPHHDRLARRPATRDQLVRRIPLGDHPADEHHVGPSQVFRAQRPHVHIHQALRPRFRQHRGHRQQAQRRERGSFVDEFQGVLETPECVRKLRV